MTVPAARNMCIVRPLGLAACLVLLVGCGAQDLYEPPGSPYSERGRVALPSNNEGVAVLGHYAFVAGGQAGLHVIDIADPSQPQLVTTFNTLKTADNIDIVRTFADQTLRDVAMVVEGTEGITTYDITDPPNVASFNQGSTAVDGKGLFIQESEDPDAPYLVFLAESWKGIRIFESDPAVPGLLQYNGVFASTNGYAEGIAVKDGWAYIADDEMGLAVMDVRVLAYGVVQVVSWCDSPGNALDVCVVDDHAYVADGTEGLAVFTINGSDEPVRVASLDLSGYSKSIAVRDNLACLAAAGGGVHFVDVTRPNRPVYLGTVVTSYANDLTLTEDGYVIVCDRDEGLIVLGGHGPFRDRTAPAKVTTLTAAPYSTDGIRLTWYATGDDRYLGRATGCEIRHAAAPITDESAWQSATPVSNPPTPAEPGELQTFVAGALPPASERHFAVKIVDDAGHASALSNTVSATPFEGIVLLESHLEAVTGTIYDTFTYEVRYLYGLEPTVHDVVVDDTDRHAMEKVPMDFGIGDLYRFQTKLPAGSHTFAFSFAASDGASAEIGPTAGPLVGRLLFTMGSPDNEPGRDADETLHAVALSDSLIASDHEVTQAEWEAEGLVNPSSFVGPGRPVENVTWLQAVEYCNLRSATDLLTSAYTIQGEQVSWNRGADGWRLPTEAEWEWLCRAGTETAFAGGDITVTNCGVDPVLQQYGWYCGNADTRTGGVKQLLPNDFGLYDMHGNVWEWCWDWYGAVADEPALDPAGPDSGFQRVIRGGSWYYFASDCRSASRGTYWPASADNIVGFRVVRTVFQ